MDKLGLKWGGLKYYDFSNNEEALAKIDEYYAEGVCMSAALHKNSEKQKQTLCELIDLVNGEIYNDWTGESLTKEQAKDYILNYRKNES